MPKATPLSIAELAALLPRMTATLHYLQTLAAPARGGRGGARGRRSTEETSDLQSKMIAALKRSKKGLSLGALTKAVGAKDHVVAYQLRRMREQKKVRVVGDRRNARWLTR